ncbi:MAG: hypothetical protein NTU41_15010 [Chloroflexi bacterium]|nr:hypothetical protein [Chloroflexota bacterium]
MQCAYHPGRDVVGTCVNCGKFVCAECEVIVQGKVHCRFCVDRMLPSEQSTPLAGNTSGQGRLAVAPPEVRGWNWGAFFLTWIWGIGHGVWISLVCLIPYVNIVFAFVLGAKGNQWAWQSRQWESVDRFKKTQRIWAWVGLVVFLVGLALMVVLIRWAQNTDSTVSSTALHLL